MSSKGPRGLVFGYNDPVAVAKVLVDFAAQHRKLQIDGGAFEGEILLAERVESLATTPDLESLQMRVIRQAMAPGSRLAATARGPGRRIAGALAALVEKLETSDPGTKE